MPGGMNEEAGAPLPRRCQFGWGLQFLAAGISSFPESIRFQLSEMISFFFFFFSLYSCKEKPENTVCSRKGMKVSSDSCAWGLLNRGQAEAAAFHLLLLPGCVSHPSPSSDGMEDVSPLPSVQPVKASWCMSSEALAQACPACPRLGV